MQFSKRDSSSITHSFPFYEHTPILLQLSDYTPMGLRKSRAGGSLLIPIPAHVDDYLFVVPSLVLQVDCTFSRRLGSTGSVLTRFDKLNDVLNSVMRLFDKRRF